MNPKIYDRILKLRSYNVQFPTRNERLSEINTKIFNGALLYSGLTFNAEDSQDVIFEKLRKNLYLAELELGIMLDDKKNTDTIIETANTLTDFMDRHIETTDRMMASIVDWQNSFKGNVLYYDSMIYDTMVSSYRGIFNPISMFYYFGNATRYDQYQRSIEQKITVVDEQSTVYDGVGDTCNISTISSSSFLTVRSILSTGLRNYGIGIRCSTNFYRNNQKISSDDVFPIYGNSYEEVKVYGVKDGNIYRYDFTITFHPFFEDSQEYDYVTKDIVSGKVKNSMWLSSEYSGKFISTTLTKTTGSIVVSTNIPANMGEYKIADLGDGKVYTYDSENKKIIKSVVSSDMFGYEFQDSFLADAPDTIDFKEMYYGANCFVDTKTKETVNKYINVVGTYSHRVEDLVSSDNKIDIPIFISTPASFVEQQWTNGTRALQLNSFSVEGKFLKTPYVTENGVSYTYRDDISSVLSGKSFGCEYDPVNNITTIYVSIQNKPTEVSYQTQILPLLKKNGYKIESWEVSSNYSYEGFQLFNSRPEKSITLMMENEFKINPESKITDLRAKIDADGTKTVEIIYNIMLIKSSMINKYTAKFSILEDGSFYIKSNSSIDNLNGFSVSLNGIVSDGQDFQKDKDVSIEILGNLDYLMKKFEPVKDSKKVRLFSGKKYKFSPASIGINEFTYRKINGITYLFVKNNITKDLSNNGSLISLNNKTNVPMVFQYTRKSFDDNVKYRLTLTTSYIGYPLKKLKVYGK